MTDGDYSRVNHFLDCCPYDLRDEIFRECLKRIDPDEFMRIAESFTMSRIQFPYMDEDIDWFTTCRMNCRDEEFIYEYEGSPEDALLSEMGREPMFFLADMLDTPFTADLMLLEAIGRNDIVRDVLLRIATGMRTKDTLLRRVVPGAVERYAAWLEGHAGDGDVLNAVWGLAEDRESTPLRYR
ncbi:MAG: hypothetical protein Q4Q58_03455 [Thermoplasmata archaeon]|nr:hypothetical protein [Thermoplasmata archaeon]